MRIVYVTRFFAPEVGAASVRATECVRCLTELGHHVTVITGFPNYLKGEIYKGYRNRLIERDSLAGARVVRTFTWVDSRASFLKRLVNQMGFGFFALLGGLFARECDAVVASSPPFTAAIAGWLLSRMKRAAFVFEVRDLYPGSAKAFGVITNATVLRVLTWFEELLYRRANMIVCATQGLVDDITARGIPRAKVFKVLNGVNTDRFQPDIDSRAVRRSLGLDGKRVIVYTGIFGRAHGVPVLLDAAGLLRKHDHIAFVLVGDGVDRELLMERKRREDLSNVVFVEPQPPERVPEYIACSDVGFASLRQGEFTRRSVPVKMFEYMACARPVILCGSGEAADLLQAADAGVSVEAGDCASLAHVILELCEDPKERRRYGENGRRFSVEYLSRRELAKDFERALITAVGNHQPPRREVSWTNE